MEVDHYGEEQEEKDPEKLLLRDDHCEGKELVGEYPVCQRERVGKTADADRVEAVRTGVVR